MDRFFTSLKENRFIVNYDEPFNQKWNDNEICLHIIELNCGSYLLTSLPD